MSDDHERREAPLDRRSRVLRGLTAVVVTAALTIYFASAALTTAPLNPLTIRHGGLANDVVTPYFIQNWQLFAPDPISEDRGLVARARCGDGTETAYADLTTEHVQAIHDTRLFPSRMSRIISNGLLSIFLQDPYLARYREIAADSDSPEELAPVSELSPEEREFRLRGETTLVRFAADSLRDRCEGDVAAVQLRFVIHKFPRWSQRENWRDKGEVLVLDNGWSEL